MCVCGRGGGGDAAFYVASMGTPDQVRPEQCEHACMCTGAATRRRPQLSAHGHTRLQVFSKARRRCAQLAPAILPFSFLLRSNARTHTRTQLLHAEELDLQCPSKKQLCISRYGHRSPSPRHFTSFCRVMGGGTAQATQEAKWDNVAPVKHVAQQGTSARLHGCDGVAT